MFALPDLPYAPEALEPVMSVDTVQTHYGKHHRKYVETVNQLVDKLDWRASTMEEVVREAARRAETKLFNNAGQAWNHGFYWASMQPGGGRPEGEIASLVARDFGGLEALRAKFVEQGVAHFGSGWIWLALEDGKLVLTCTHDGDCLLTRPEQTPLLLCDLWEHAYYLDHKNDRKAFLEAWFDRLANWSFAARQLGGQIWRYPEPVREPA